MKLLFQNSKGIDLKSLLSLISGRRRLAAGLALVVTLIVMEVVPMGFNQVIPIC